MTEIRDNYGNAIHGISAGFRGGHACNCIGPQNGYPVCPCRMGRLKQVDGRWIETIDHGPVRQTMSSSEQHVTYVTHGTGVYRIGLSVNGKSVPISDFFAEPQETE